jgi:hypothetical protein
MRKKFGDIIERITPRGNAIAPEIERFVVLQALDEPRQYLCVTQTAFAELQKQNESGVGVSLGTALRIVRIAEE